MINMGKKSTQSKNKVTVETRWMEVKDKSGSLICYCLNYGIFRDT